MNKPGLKELAKHSQINVVLRVPNAADNAISNTVNTTGDKILYNTIEKELIKEGFSVRDRGLVNEILKNSQNADYSKITELTNTDIIIEVVDINKEIVYSTNAIVPVKTKTGKVLPTKIEDIDYKSKGASIEYKVVQVKTNEIVGLYKFNYKPCPESCQIGTFKQTAKPKTRHSRKGEIREYAVDLKSVDEFIKVSVKQLVEAIKE